MTRKTMATIVAGLLAIAALWAGGRKVKQAVMARQDIPVLQTSSHAFFDGSKDAFYFARHPRGEYTASERKARTRVLRDGSVLLDDGDLTFYKVRSGETLSAIRLRLGRSQEFEHFRVQLAKLDSFNIPALQLKAGMWLPLPLDRDDRSVSPEQFLAYAATALREMRTDSVYGPATMRLLSRVSWDDIIVLATATAIQEAGGRPLGRLELHRWERGQQAFSFGYQHVVMVGPGLRARQRLGLTEGQTYHPVNSCKLFLAFLIEKGREMQREPASFFPLEDGGNLVRYAAFYNGTAWRSINPNYVANTEQNLRFARKVLSRVQHAPTGSPLVVADNR